MIILFKIQISRQNYNKITYLWNVPVVPVLPATLQTTSQYLWIHHSNKNNHKSCMNSEKKLWSTHIKRECECADSYPLSPLLLRVSSRLWMPLYWILVTNPPGLDKYTCTMPLSITTCNNLRIFFICYAMLHSSRKVRKQLMSHLIVFHIQFHCCWWGHGDDLPSWCRVLADMQVLDDGEFGQVLLQL